MRIKHIFHFKIHTDHCAQQIVALGTEGCDQKNATSGLKRCQGNLHAGRQSLEEVGFESC